MSKCWRGSKSLGPFESELGSDSGKLDDIVQNNRFVKFAQQCNMELTRFLDELAPIGSSEASKDGWVSVTEEKPNTVCGIRKKWKLRRTLFALREW